MTIGERIKHLRHVELRLSRQAFAEQVGLSNESSVVDIEREKKRAKGEVIQAICDKFQVRPAWLGEGLEPVFKSEQEKKSEKALASIGKASRQLVAASISEKSPSIHYLQGILFGLENEDPEFVRAQIEQLDEALTLGSRHRAFMVPKYDVKAHAGVGEELIDVTPFVEVVAFETAWLERRLGLRQGECALVQVTGDSMAPTLLDSDVVLLDTRVNSVADSGVYAFVQRGRIRIKRVQMRLNGSLKLISDNPIYEAEEIAASDADHFRVIGRVVWPRLK